MFLTILMTLPLAYLITSKPAHSTGRSSESLNHLHMPSTLSSKEFNKYIMIKRLENDIATLLQQFLLEAPNNVYVKNSKLHKNPFPRSIFFHIIQSLVHTICSQGFAIFFLEEKHSLLFSSIQNKSYQSHLTGILGFRSTKAPIFARRVSSFFKKYFCTAQKVSLIESHSSISRS